jgi:hypothetical protein
MSSTETYYRFPSDPTQHLPSIEQDAREFAKTLQWCVDTFYPRSRAKPAQAMRAALRASRRLAIIAKRMGRLIHRNRHWWAPDDTGGGDWCYPFDVLCSIIGLGDQLDAAADEARTSAEAVRDIVMTGVR